MFEDVNFEASESGQGVKFVTSAVNWTMCRPGVDDYNDSMSKLITAMRAKGWLANTVSSNLVFLFTSLCMIAIPAPGP